MNTEIKNSGFSYDAFDIVKFAWGKKWILISISIAAFIISAVISLMIAPKYKSTVIMFPAAAISMSKSLVETGTPTSDAKDVLTYGDDEEAERLLQILKSDRLANHLIEKFNLMEHYKIDTNSKYPNTTLKNTLLGNIKTRRTEYNSIEIEVYDNVPQMAADMANEITTYTDTIFYKIGLNRAQEAYNIVLNEINLTQNNIDSITESLNVLRSYGISEYSQQSGALNRAYGKALLKKDNEVIKIIETKLATLQKYGSLVTELTVKNGWEISRLSSLQAKLAAANVNLKPTISNVFIVDKATPAEKKSSPKRSLIVFMSTLSTFAFALLMLLLIDKFKSQV